MRHPYVGLPDRQFWKKEPGIKNGSDLDPVSDTPFQISETDRIVTAGSCFAQHVARFMSMSGFNHHITEQAHPVLPKHTARTFNYGMFAARYGNVYTARQLKQLLQRAFGEFTPKQTSWSLPDSTSVVDPFRPQIQPGGFMSEAELLLDRHQHFKAIRDAIEEMDVFVFTLGLTERWEDSSDGAVFPIAPGIAGGTYDPATVNFVNFDEKETYSDLSESIEFIRSINPSVRIILTVSPVALNATYEDRHVLLSTAWSKAVLRLVAQKLVDTFDDCVYFPSYEIITSPHARGQYFAPDCREVTEDGVEHVMQLFVKHFTSKTISSEKKKPVAVPRTETHEESMQRTIDVLCDEEAINNE